MAFSFVASLVHPQELEDELNVKFDGGGVRRIVGKKRSDGQVTIQGFWFDGGQFNEAQITEWLKSRDLKPISVDRLDQTSEVAAQAECPKCETVSIMMHSDDPEEYQCPQCEAQMKARTIETTTLEGMNLFRAGRWMVDGKLMTFDIDFLDKVIANFNAGYMEPYIKITADGQHTPQPPIFRNLAFGWVDKLWRIGERLYANFKDVPLQVAEGIKKGLIKKRSVEIPLNFTLGNGEKVGPVLKAALFFGQGRPLVHGLEDLVPVFNEGDEPESVELPADDTEQPNDPPDESEPDAAPSDGDSDPVTGNEPEEPEGSTDDTEKESETMADDKITISKQEYEDLKRAQVDGKLANERIDSIEVQMKESSDTKLAAEERASKAEERAKAAEAKVLEARVASIDAFVSDRVQAGQIKPASKDAEVARMKVMSEEEETEYREVLAKLEEKYPKTAGLENKEPETKAVKTTSDSRDKQLNDYLDANPEFVAKHPTRLAAYKAADQVVEFTAPETPKE